MVMAIRSPLLSLSSAATATTVEITKKINNSMRHHSIVTSVLSAFSFSSPSSCLCASNYNCCYHRNYHCQHTTTTTLHRGSSSSIGSTRGQHLAASSIDSDRHSSSSLLSSSTSITKTTTTTTTSSTTTTTTTTTPFTRPSASSSSTTKPSKSTSSSSSILAEQRIQDLITHPAVSWSLRTTFASMHKKKLGVRHLPLLNRRRRRRHDESTSVPTTTTKKNESKPPIQDYLFDEFASAICHANDVIPRKEVFETWSAALHIHASFFTEHYAVSTTNSNRDDKDNNDDHDLENNNVAPIRRVVDVAAGHGLLAWALLLLDDEYQRSVSSRRYNHQQLPTTTTTSLPPLTAFCLDVNMPPSASLIHSSMIQHFPNLQSRFHYVEGRLEQLIPHPSCLLASVHSCGIITDMLVATAAQRKVPIAVVPCCHSRKSIVLDVASPFAREEYEDIVLLPTNYGEKETNTNANTKNLADRLDMARKKALINAGLEVKEVYLPKLFTDKNRLIMGFVSMDADTTTVENLPLQSLSNIIASSSSSSSSRATLTSLDNNLLLPTSTKTVVSSLRGNKNNFPPLHDHSDTTTRSPSTMLRPKPRYMKGFSIPCQDSIVHRQFISQLSGKEAANTRKKVMHNRKNTASPQLDVSLWLPPLSPPSPHPPKDDNQDEVDESSTEGIVSEGTLSSLIRKMNHGVDCIVTKVGEVYVDPKSGRRAQTFRIQYGVTSSSSFSQFWKDCIIQREEHDDMTNNDAYRMDSNAERTIVLSFEDAKRMHAKLCEFIPIQFPGTACR